MKIAIIAAMDKELSLLKNLMDSVEENRSGNDTFYNGKIGNHDIVLMKVGIGKVNSALRTYKLLCSEHPDLVINSGVAGGADSMAPIGTVLVADGVGYHDVWCGPGTIPGQADGYPAIFKPYPRGIGIAKELEEEDPNIRIGLVASGDMFISKPEEIVQIKQIYPSAMACDMESAAIAHTCAESGVPFMVIRVVSDMPGGNNNIEEYQNFWEHAPELVFNTVKALLERL